MSTASRIQKAAFARFGAKGYAATSLKEIASDCGIQKSSIYSHFASKEALFKSLVQSSAYDEMEFAREQLLRPVPAAEALRELLTTIVTRFAVSPSLRFWVQTLYLPPACLKTDIKGYAGIYYSGVRSVVIRALELGTEANEHKRLFLSLAYLGILKGLYAELLQDSGMILEETLSALWSMYQCAMEL